MKIPSFRKVAGRKGTPWVAALLVFVCVWYVLMALSTPRDLFPRNNYATVLLSAEGRLLGARLAPDGQWRFPASPTVPSKVEAALIRYEDHRFRHHLGVDVLAMVRAIVQNLRQQSVVSGGSTLTMQLARLSYGKGPRTVLRKIVEANRALFLELRYSKEEILALYCAHAPFGGNVVGVEAASWRYWGRNAASLSWAEAATLAVLPNAPSLIHVGRNRERLLEKRNTLLARLHDDGNLSDTDYSLALEEPLPIRPHPLPSEAPHLLDRMCRDRQGQTTVTTLQSGLQRRAQETANQYARRYSANEVHNVSALIAEVGTGHVLAYVGNASFEAPASCGNQVDVVPAPRSSGSILKPFLYAAALQDGTISPTTLLADIPTDMDGFRPQNFSKRYSGAVPAQTALIRSLNVPMVHLLRAYGTGRFLSLLSEVGLTTLTYPEDHYGATLILGGGEVSLWDLAGSYASMARVLNHYMPYNGKYDSDDWHPLRLTALQPAQKNPYLSDKTPLNAASVWQTFEAMSEVSRPEEESDWRQFDSMKRIAWKTGTSYGSRDAWAVGVTSRYVVAVWVGNADGEGRAGLTGVGYAGPVLFSLFSLLPDSPWFYVPYDEMAQMAVCRESGYKAGSQCPADTAWVQLSAIERLDKCPYHRLVHLSADGHWRVDSSCYPVSRMQSCAWFELPPTMAYFYRREHLSYQPMPAWLPGCDPAEKSPIQLFYPTQGLVMVPVRGMDGRVNPFVFRAAHNRPSATLFWHLDGSYLGETSGPDHAISCIPPAGRHTLVVVDSDGHSSQVSFTVR